MDSLYSHTRSEQPSFEKILLVWSIKKYSAETNCMQRSALRQAGFSFLYLPIFRVFYLHPIRFFSPAKAGAKRAKIGAKGYFDI
jgi:hypothetical protein